MFFKTTLTTAVLAALTGLAGAADRDAPDTRSPYDANVEDLTPRGEPPMLGIHWSKEMHAARRGGSGANMTYHGGKVMTTATTMPIFMGTSWPTYNGDKITGMDAWYTGFSGSHYAATVKEYSGTNGYAGSANTAHLGHFVYGNAETSKGNTTAVLNQVCSALAASGVTIDPNGNGYYPLYSDQPRGNAGYCAYHSAGTCGGKPIQFAFFWKLDGDAGCDPGDTSNQHSQGLAAIANVSGHELAEAMTDPATPAAWYDASGNENGDKCAWTFGAPLVQFSNGIYWKIQGEWSNAAYTAGTGYANSSGQKGCLSGL